MNQPINSGTASSRVMVLAYGILSYFIGVAGLACIIVALANFLPFGFLSEHQSAVPIIWNLLLVTAWGFIHTIMARDSFKNWLTRLLPEPAERPTYVLVAGVTSVLLIGYWQPVPQIIWSTTNELATLLIWVLFGFGWVYLLASTFAINHFDLFGLRQVYLNYKSQPRAPLPFTKRAMYRFTRHPIQTGVLIGVWATPVMLGTQFILSIGFTIYIFIGLWFEEKDLIKDIGQPYEDYRHETGKVFPKFTKSDNVT